MIAEKVLIFLAAFVAICNAAENEHACDTNTDCTKFDLLCVSGICKCEKGRRVIIWSSTPDNTGKATCELVFNGACQNDGECKDLEGSICDKEKCACRDSYFPDLDDRQCVINSGPRQPCKITAQCTPAMGQHAECRNNVCLCKSDYYIRTDGKCDKANLAGGTCTNSDQCLQEINGQNVLQCSNGQCACKEGYIQINDICSGANYNAGISIATVLLMLCGIFLTEN